MAPLRKLLICPYFGDLPEWYDKYQKNVEETLKKQGYDMLVTTDLEAFKQRVQSVWPNINYPGLPGTGKVWDYRCTFGDLFAEELKGYDYWGHCDFDMVFGDVSKWFPDEEIAKLDIWSNHDTYICGPWTLYRNTPEVNSLYKKRFMWSLILSDPTSFGWVEKDYSRIVEQSGLKYRYSFMQGDPYTETPNLTYTDGKLFQDGVEIPMFHFRRSKRWPL